MKIQTHVKAGVKFMNHNRSQLSVRTSVRAGGRGYQHNEAQVSSLRVRSGVKAGFGEIVVTKNLDCASTSLFRA